MATYKERARAALLEKAHAKNLCDDRDIAFFATAKSMPNDSYGMTFLALNAQELIICDADMQGDIGEIRYRIQVNEVQGFLMKKGLFGLGAAMEFSHEGKKYSFTNISVPKETLDVLVSVCKE